MEALRRYDRDPPPRSDRLPNLPLPLLRRPAGRDQPPTAHCLATACLAPLRLTQAAASLPLDSASIARPTLPSPTSAAVQAGPLSLVIIRRSACLSALSSSGSGSCSSHQLSAVRMSVLFVRARHGHSACHQAVGQASGSSSLVSGSARLR